MDLVRSVKRRVKALLHKSVARIPSKDDPAWLILDPDYYAEQYKDVSKSGMSPADHYFSVGRQKMRRPSALFDAVWYASRNPEVSRKGMDPLAHFIRKGGAGGRNPSLNGFDCGWYLQEYPEVAKAGQNPLIHWLVDGVGLGYSPNSKFDTKWYLANYPEAGKSGLDPLSHYLRVGKERGHSMSLVAAQQDGRVDELVLRRNPNLNAVRTIPGRSLPRLNLVTDSLDSNSLMGGVATAIILATLWAQRSGRRLRIVTRTTQPSLGGLAELYRSVGLPRPEEEPEVGYAPLTVDQGLEVADSDIFLTTSWLSTAATLKTIPAARVAYILQEDERAFYPIGSQQLWAAETMNHPDIAVVVNTSNLRKYLIETGIANLAETSVAFEPSFASFLRPGRKLGSDDKRKLFFYARPNNARNLFDLGLMGLDAAKEAGGLDPAKWEVHMVGRNIPPVSFVDGSLAVIHDSMGWAQYREMLGGIDLGYSLMASPHPSYPPLDLMASGSVVMTNNWPGKVDLSAVSNRLVTAEPTVASLAAGLIKAADLVEEVADSPFEPNPTPFFADWQTNLDAVVEHLVRRFDV